MKLHVKPSRLLLAVLALAGSACQTDADRAGPQPLAAPATAPGAKSGSLQTFEDKKLGIRFQYPGGWQKVACKTAVFDVAPPAGSVKGAISLSLDVPALPMHIPGLLPIGEVTSGYIDDLRKTMKDLKVEENTYLKVNGANARRVRCTGKVDGKPSTDFALVAVHGDRVYILSADSDADGIDAAKQAFDAAVGSVAWVK